MERDHFNVEIRDNQIIISLSDDKYRDVSLSIIIKDIETNVPVWSDKVSLSNDIYYWCTIDNMDIYHGFIINIYSGEGVIFDRNIRLKNSYGNIIKKQCLFIADLGGLGDQLYVEPLIRKISNAFEQKIIVLAYYPQIFINHPCIEKFIKINDWYALDDIEKNIPEEYLDKDKYNIRYVLRWERDRFGYVPHWTSYDLRQYAAMQYGITLKKDEMNINFYPDDFINIENLPEKYVCINPSITGVDRTWSFENWQKLIYLLNSNNINVVAIGKNVDGLGHDKHDKKVYENLIIEKGLNLINNELQDSLSQCWHIINKSDAFISFPSGLFSIASTTDTNLVEFGTPGDPCYNIPYRHGKSDYKYTYIGGKCDIKCFSDIKYTIQYLGYFGNNGIAGNDRLGFCFKNFKEFLCHPKPNDVFIKLSEILGIP